MDNKSYGLFLLVLGTILLVISLMTIWSMFINFNLSNALLITLSIPLFIFSITSIIFAIILITQESLNEKVKGVLMILNGIISILAAVYTILDFRLSGLGLINIIVLVPMMLVGVFFIIDGILVFASEHVIREIKAKKRSGQFLGIVSIVVGLINIIAFILLLSVVPDHPIILSTFWLLLSVVLVLFGIKSIIKKVDS
ncbi:MAG: hypothetical protein EU542_02280 [Promethearchaeota archaeon]|nr:MAG: hypothetical protein EU542_02280 [Candidatus Lokiarchaeota archaeon]